MAEIGNSKNGKIRLRDLLQTILLLIVIVGFIVEWKTSAQKLSEIAATQTEKVQIEKRFTALETNYQNIEKMLGEIKKDLRDHMEKSK